MMVGVMSAFSFKSRTSCTTACASSLYTLAAGDARKQKATKNSVTRRRQAHPPQTHGMPDSPLAPSPAGKQAGRQTGTYHSFSLARMRALSPGKAFTNGTPESPCRATAPSIGIEKLLTMPHISTSRCLCPCPKTYCLAPNKSLSSPIASSDSEYFAGASGRKVSSPLGAGNDGLRQSRSGFTHCKFECVDARCATPSAILSRIGVSRTNH